MRFDWRAFIFNSMKSGLGDEKPYWSYEDIGVFSLVLAVLSPILHLFVRLHLLSRSKLETPGIGVQLAVIVSLMVALYLVLKLRHWRPVIRPLGWVWPRTAYLVLAPFLGALLAAGVAAYLRLRGQSTPTMPLVDILVLGLALGPILEESFFRGCLLPVLAHSFGEIHHLPRIVPGLPEVRTLAPRQQQQVVSQVHLFDDFGNLAGRLLFAFLVVRISSQGRLLRSFLLPVLIVFPFVFLFAAQSHLRLLEYGVAIAVALMVAQFSFWGNYLPRVYPTHLRGTGESFAANIGGRMLGSIAALLTTQLALVVPASDSFGRVAHAAGAVALLVCCVALVASFWLPEPTQELPA